MDKIIDVIITPVSKKVYSYIGKHAPDNMGLTINEIIQGLPDYTTARSSLFDIMATLAEYESAKEAGRLVYLPFSSDGLLTVSAGSITITSNNPEIGQKIELSGKICVFKCSEEESARHDAAAEEIIKKRMSDNEI